MKESLFKILLITGIMTTAGLAQEIHAQAACSSSGETVGFAAEFGNTSYAIGDLTVVGTGVTDPSDVNDGDWILTGTANVDVYASIEIPAGMVVRLKPGAVLNIYGNVTNNGIIQIEPGATINFYGETWTNGTGAIVGDGISPSVNAIPGGAVNFIAPRLVIPASLNATACVMSNYSGGDDIQYIDGGSIPMDIALHIQNDNNIQLINTNTSLEGLLVFDVNDGDMSLGNNSLIFTTNANWMTNVALDQAFILTNGTLSCADKVIKDVLPNEGMFTFHIGRAETYFAGRDYTPAVITNSSGASDRFLVSVKDYDETNAQGATIFYEPEGMYRAWQVTSDNGSPIHLQLQHNAPTNGSAYNSTGGDSFAFITQNQGAGVWDVGLFPVNSTGTTTGSQAHYRNVITATDCSEPLSWLTKTPDVYSPLPVELVRFEVQKAEQTSLLTWTTASEKNNDGFYIERSSDGIYWETLGFVASLSDNGNSAVPLDYLFTDAQPLNGINYYRFKQVDFDGTFEYSPVRSLEFEEQTATAALPYLIYPNPTSGVVNIANLKINSKIYLTNVTGQLIGRYEIQHPQHQLSLEALPGGSYFIMIEDPGKQIQTFKIIKQ